MNKSKQKQYNDHQRLPKEGAQHKEEVEAFSYNYQCTANLYSHPKVERSKAGCNGLLLQINQNRYMLRTMLTTGTRATKRNVYERNHV